MTRRQILLMGVAPAIILGQTERQKKAKQALEAALQALGGDKFLSMRDRTETGRVYSFSRERLAGASQARIFTRYLTRPEPPRIDFFGQRERQSFGKNGKEDFAYLFTETEAWQITYRGARPYPKDQEERYRDSTRRNLLYMLRQRMGEPGMILEYEGTQVEENMPVEVVSITDSENKVVRAFIHTSTHLPVKQEYSRFDEKTRERFDEVTRFAKYRDVSGVQWPYQMQRDRDGEKIFEIFSESVTINDDLKDDMFALNTKIKVLPPAR